MSKKRPPQSKKPPQRPLRLRRRISQFLLLVALALLCTVSWYIHQPRVWREHCTAAWPSFWVGTLENFGHALADYTDALGLTGRDVSVALPVFNSHDQMAFAGEPRALTGGPAPQDIVVLHKRNFSIGWSPSRRHAIWAAYRIPHTANPQSLKRPSRFYDDPEAPNAPQHADYTKSGYDRGHLVPNHAIASRFGQEAQRETFLMSNVAPQRPWLNQGPWADIEQRAADDWSRRYGEVWVIVGTITATNANARKLQGGIGIPTAFYQIAVARKGECLTACAVVMPQRISRRARPRAYLASIREIESLSGLDFCWALPDPEEQRLESALPSRLWPSGLRGTIAILKRRSGIYPD